jgi:uncharacterized protein DUF4062
MELFPASDAEQFEFINSIIDDCDYYVVIIGGRYGSVSAEGLSFTEKEYQYARSKGIPVLAFIHEDPGSIPAVRSELDPTLREKLEAFKRELRDKRLSAPWKNPDDLALKVATSLLRARKTHPRPGWVRGDQAASVQILGELAAAQRRIGELEAKLDSEDVVEDIDMVFPDMDIAFVVNERVHHILVGLDQIFLTIGSSLAVKSRTRTFVDGLEAMISKLEPSATRLQILQTDVDRVRSFLFAKGLIDLGEDDEGYWTLTLTPKGRRVLSALIAEQEDDAAVP